MKNSLINKSWFKIAEIIVGILCSIIFTIISQNCGSNNIVADIFVGYMIPLVILFPFHITGISPDKTHELDNALDDLKSRNKAVYELYLAEIQELTKTVEDSKESLLYMCSYKPNMRLYKSVCKTLMSSFSGNNLTDYFYATAECSKESVEWFFDEENLAGEFLPLLNEMYSTKKITKFNRLFIYDEKDFSNPVLAFLIHLHKKTKEKYSTMFDFRFISVEHFKNYILNTPNISAEMGVWGNHCVFIQSANASMNKGYLFNDDVIKQHKQVFENLWKNAKTIDEITIDPNMFEVHDNFELAIFEIINEFGNQTVTINRNKNKKDIDLSLDDIREIQAWVKTHYPRRAFMN